MPSDSTRGRVDYSNEPVDERDRDLDPRNKPMKKELTPEEMQILKDFRTESYWYKCVPFTAFNCILLHFATRRGYVKRHPRFGYMFPYLGAISLGYIGGKLLAFPEFREKMLKLKEGDIADEFRAGQTGNDRIKPRDDTMSHPNDTGFNARVDRRKGNRAEFEQPSRQPLQPSSDYQFQPKPKTNQYGDIVEE